MPPQATQDDELAKYAAKPAGDDELSKYAANPAGPDPLKTGAGMEAAAHEQARETPAKAGAKMQPNWTALALEHTPSGADPHNPGNPNMNAIPESARGDVNSRLATISSMTTPAMGTLGEIAEEGSLRPLIPYVRGAAGSYLGGKGGEWAGREAGSLVGHPGEGAMIGGAAGALYGGYKGYKGQPIAIPSWRGALRNVLSEAGEVQVPPTTIPEPPPNAPPEEIIPDRLSAHRGDVRTPMPRPATIRRGPGEILPESVSSGPDVRVGEPPRSGTSELPGGGVIKRPPIGLLPENVPSAPLPAKPLKTIPQQGTIPEKPVISSAPFELQPEPFEKEPPVQTELEIPKATETKPSVKRIGELIEQGTGADRLKTIPLRDQPRPNLSVGQSTSEVINKATEPEAVRPLASGPQKSMKLKDITGPPAEEVPHRATMTHEGKTFGMEAANGKNMYEATKHDSALAKSVHDLRNNDVRQAFLNAGGDVSTVGMEGQRFKVGNTTSNERSQMFDYMLKKGLKPEQIVELARKPIQ